MSAGSYDTLWDAAWSEAASHGPGFRSRYELLLGRMSALGLAGRLLEVGAGQGHLLRRLHRRFPWVELSAHEVSPGAVSALRELDFLVGVFDGPIEPGGLGHSGFHTVVCSEVLEHIPDDGAALDAMIALLLPRRPDGHRPRRPRPPRVRPRTLVLARRPEHTRGAGLRLVRLGDRSRGGEADRRRALGWEPRHPPGAVPKR